MKFVETCQYSKSNEYSTNGLHGYDTRITKFMICVRIVISLGVLSSLAFGLGPISTSLGVFDFLKQVLSGHQWDHTRFPNLAISKGLEPEDFPSLKWILAVIEKARLLIGNDVANGVLDKIEKKSVLHKKFVSIIRYELSKFPLTKSDGKRPTDVPKDLKPYEDLFARLPLPEASKHTYDDNFFAFMRVGGFNPLLLERVASLPENFKMTNEIFKEAPGFRRDSLEKALREGRLYLANLKITNDVKPGMIPMKKVVYSPIGLFGVSRGEKTLRPIAIQTGQNPGNRIVTPSDGLRWQQAKIIFNTADSNFHELISHLGRTHLLLEPFVVATSKLPKGHAIKDIVTVHLEGTAFINELAIDTLVALGGPVDQLLMGELASELQKLTVASIKEPGFNGLMLKKFLSDRGLLNAPLDYPYRDDALKLWDATYKWMTAYVDVFYKSDDDVRNDADLQIWAKSLASKDGGQLNGFGEYDRPGVLTTKWYLVDVLTMIAFTGGCQHAAVNFAQYGFMAFAPLAPLAGYKDPDDRINSPVEMFPPISQALSQLNVVGLLGRVYYTTYGKYTQGFAENEALKAPLNKFWKELDAIEASIEKRNKKAKFPYPYLIPSKIPQSINI